MISLINQWFPTHHGHPPAVRRFSPSPDDGDVFCHCISPQNPPHRPFTSQKNHMGSVALWVLYIPFNPGPAEVHQSRWIITGWHSIHHNPTNFLPICHPWIPQPSFRFALRTSGWVHSRPIRRSSCPFYWHRSRAALRRCLQGLMGLPWWKFCHRSWVILAVKPIETYGDVGAPC